MVDNSCSACANPTNEYKKGGKVKKGKKGVSQSVLCDRCSRRALNATVLLRKGNAPRRRSNPGVAKRLLSQGSAFGGGLPGPLNASSYGSAPQVAQPLGRMDFINSGESSYYYNRRRDQRDDFQPRANPSGIRADVSPSIRAVSSSSAVASPDTGLSASRSSAGVQAMREAFANMPQAIFQGEVSRVGGANLAPSGRALPSQPTTGFINTKGSMIGAYSSLSEMGKAQADLDNMPGGEQEFMRREAETLRGMGINPETGSPLPSPRSSNKSASASARGMRRGGSVF